VVEEQKRLSYVQFPNQKQDKNCVKKTIRKKKNHISDAGERTWLQISGAFVVLHAPVRMAPRATC
jgi:hypothetical protein